MTTINDAWEAFAHTAIPPDATDERRAALKRVYYGGAASVFTMICQDVDPEAISGELRLYFSAVGATAAERGKDG